MSISYECTKERWNINEIFVDNIFSCNISFDIISGNMDLELKSIKEYQHRND
jgi:hypothetical protein